MTLLLLDKGGSKAGTSIPVVLMQSNGVPSSFSFTYNALLDVVIEGLEQNGVNLVVVLGVALPLGDKVG